MLPRGQDSTVRALTLLALLLYLIVILLNNIYISHPSLDLCVLITIFFLGNYDTYLIPAIRTKLIMLVLFIASPLSKHGIPKIFAASIIGPRYYVCSLYPFHAYLTVILLHSRQTVSGVRQMRRNHVSRNHVSVALDCNPSQYMI